MNIHHQLDLFSHKHVWRFGAGTHDSLCSKYSVVYNLATSAWLQLRVMADFKLSFLVIKDPIIMFKSFPLNFLVVDFSDMRLYSKSIF